AGPARGEPLGAVGVGGEDEPAGRGDPAAGGRGLHGPDRRTIRHRASSSHPRATSSARRIADTSGIRSDTGSTTGAGTWSWMTETVTVSPVISTVRPHP